MCFENLLSARKALTGPLPARYPLVSSRPEIAIHELPTNDNRPHGTGLTFFYNILAPYFIRRPKYESKGIDFKKYNTFEFWGAQRFRDCARATGAGWAARCMQNARGDVRGAAEKAGSTVWAGREAACTVMLVPQKQGQGGRACKRGTAQRGNRQTGKRAERTGDGGHPAVARLFAKY
ncbi:hypothetical protein K438DRAFT_1775562 [Mycena galopus ATCC 62051]|nr:hypothetical protein K438DRAFT_1775562 [Mycena galopus ATCC 62051]